MTRNRGLLATVIFTLTLAACGGQPAASAPPTAASAPTAAPAAPAAPAATAAPAPTAAPAATDAPAATSVPAATPTAAPAAIAAPAAFTTDDINPIVGLEKMKSHLVVSMLVWKGGEYEQAKGLATDSAAEQFPIITPALKAKNADTALQTAFDAYGALTGAAGDESKVTAAYKAAIAAVDTAEATLAGPQLDNLAFHAEIIHQLMEGVEEEYGEGYSDGTFSEAEPYQCALGFVTVAKERYEGIEDKIKADHPHEHEEIEAAFLKLESAFVDPIKLPAKAMDPKDIETSVDAVSGELQEALGLQAAATGGPAEVIAQIRVLIGKSLETYKSGDADAAYEVAAGAYLNGFEGLEGDLGKKDKDLLGTMEGQFKDLRDGIKAGKPQADLETIVKQINANLDKVAELLK